MPALSAAIDLRVEDSATLQVIRKVTWRYIPFLMLCYSFAYLDRVNVGFAREAVSADIGLSATAYGLGAGIFFIGYFVFEIPSNLLLQRYGARVWICRIMISWSIVSAAFAFISAPWMFYALRVLLGIAEAGFFPGVVLFVTQWWPAARRGQIIALFMTAIPLAGLIGAPLSGAILTAFDGVLGFAGWRWMFGLEAIPALLLGLMVLRVLDSRIPDARWLTGEEKGALIEAIGHEPPAPPAAAGVSDVLKDRTILIFGATYFACIMGQYGITFWLPTMIASASEAGMLEVGLLGAIPYGFAVLCMILVGRHSDRTGERRWHTAGPMLLGSAVLCAIPFVTDNLVISMALITLAAGAVLTATPLFWTLPTQSLSGRAAAVGIAAINSSGNLAGFLSPLLVGALTQWTRSLASGMIALSLFLLAGAFVILRFRTEGGARTGDAPSRR